MTRYIILSKSEMKTLRKNEHVIIFIDGNKYKLCTVKCFKKEEKGAFNSPLCRRIWLRFKYRLAGRNNNE